MFTGEDRAKIKKDLNEGAYGDILLICMMRNGATIDEIQEMDSIIHGTNDYNLNQIIKATTKYYSIDDALATH